MAKIVLDGTEYDASDLSPEYVSMLRELKSVQEKLSEKKNFVAVLNKARKAYISELKSEIISNKSGLDLLL